MSNQAFVPTSDMTTIYISVHMLSPLMQALHTMRLVRQSRWGAHCGVELARVIDREPYLPGPANDLPSDAVQLFLPRAAIVSVLLALDRAYTAQGRRLHRSMQLPPSPRWTPSPGELAEFREALAYLRVNRLFLKMGAWFLGLPSRSEESEATTPIVSHIGVFLTIMRDLACVDDPLYLEPTDNEAEWCLYHGDPVIPPCEVLREAQPVSPVPQATTIHDERPGLEHPEFFSRSRRVSYADDTWPPSWTSFVTPTTSGPDHLRRVYSLHPQPADLTTFLGPIRSSLDERPGQRTSDFFDRLLGVPYTETRRAALLEDVQRFLTTPRLEEGLSADRTAALLNQRSVVSETDAAILSQIQSLFPEYMDPDTVQQAAAAALSDLHREGGHI